ncbi:MAG: ABC transporter substrate-binding protein, partial [Rhodospirillales bacterium]|nr:ABC transporter substrate-binding protein [Rhodospirillales bacterium]
MTHIRMFAVGLAAGLALLIALPIVPARASAEMESGARSFVQSLAKQAVDSLADHNISRPDRIVRFRRLFTDSFAVEVIGRWVLGRHWRTATDAEQAEYLRLFEDLMVVSYVDRFAEYAGEALKVHRAVTENESTVTIFSEIVRPNGGPPVRVDWRVGRNKAAAYRIVDVVVEGTSMSNTMRADFTSVINQKGGQISGLIETLREKTAALKQQEA